MVNLMERPWFPLLLLARHSLTVNLMERPWFQLLDRHSLMQFLFLAPPSLMASLMVLPWFPLLDRYSLMVLPWFPLLRLDTARPRFRVDMQALLYRHRPPYRLSLLCTA